MSTPIPATIANEVNQRLSHLVTSARGFFPADDFSVRRLAGELDKLMHVDAVNAYLFKSGLAQLIGDEKAMRRYLDCAGKLSSDPAVQRQAAGSLINLGFFSEAQPQFIKASDPRRGQYSIGIVLGICCGAFSATVTLMEQADKLNIETPNGIRATAMKAHSILASEGITDEHVGQILDVAGDIMREQGLFYQGLEPSILPVDDAELGRCVYFTFLLAASAERVVEMQYDLTCRLVDRFHELPATLSVGFQAAGLQ